MLTVSRMPANKAIPTAIPTRATKGPGDPRSFIAILLAAAPPIMEFSGGGSS